MEGGKEDKNKDSPSLIPPMNRYSSIRTPSKEVYVFLEYSCILHLLLSHRARKFWPYSFL
jgi:hypothetical protein